MQWNRHPAFMESRPMSGDIDGQDSDFKFHTVIHDSPSSNTFLPAPADYLFLDGRLLPHVFPLRQPPVLNVDDSSTVVQTSRVRRNGLVALSMNSSCCNMRTSLKTADRRKAKRKGGASALVYGSSRRWQFMVAFGVPVRRKKEEVAEKEEFRRKREEARMKKKKKIKRNVKPCLGSKLFQWLFLFCKECHAI